jgi:transposase
VIKMLEREKTNRKAVEFFNTDAFVPENHILRKIDKAVDFTKIYKIVEELYCKDNGRPSIDPVVLFKMVLIQHLYGLSSLRRTAEEVKMNVAYRWFIGYTMNEETPHFSTISYNFKNRYTSKTVEEIFNWILSEIETAGYLSPEVVFVDGTHIKANANINKKVKEAIPEAARVYEKQLREEINRDREEHGKKPFKDDDEQPPKTKEITKSTTDPESGVFHKGEHKKCFAYEAHTACDKKGFVLDVEVTPGNVHDSKAFDKLYEKVTERFEQTKVIVADSAYKTPWICKRIIDDERIPVMPYVRPKTKENGHEWWKYVYDDYYDCVICPEYKVLHYSTTNKDGYQEFKSRSYTCEKCPTRSLCTENSKFEKTVTRHVWSSYLELAEEYRHTPEYKELYELRKEKIERVFADAKEKHGMRYTLYRGLSQVSNWVRLKFAAINLKKLAIHKWRNSPYFLFLLRSSQFYSIIVKNPILLNA